MWRHWVGEICGVSSKKEQGGDLVFDDRATKAFMKEDPKWSHVLSGIFLVGMVTTGFLYGMFHWILFILSYSQTLQSCLDTFLKGKCFLLKTLCCIIYELLSFILLLKLNFFFVLCVPYTCICKKMKSADNYFFLIKTFQPDAA